MRAANLRSLLLLPGLLTGFMIGIVSPEPSVAQDLTAVCIQPLLDRLTLHRVTPGETLASIASRYDISIRTLSHFNPGGEPRSGQTLRIPPFNGTAVRVGAGKPWKDLASQYGVRADLLFELNGCTPTSSATIFVPGNVVVAAASSQSAAVPGPTAKGPPSTTLLGLQVSDLKELPHYPLAQRSSVILGYGQYVPTGEQASMFHGGVDLVAKVGDRVFAAGAGTIAFAGTQASYGTIVVINHRNGLQTRYAQLDKLAVRQGQKIQAGTFIGTIGQSGTPSSVAPHLHYEIRINGKVDGKQGWVAQDPTPYFANKQLRIVQR